MRGTRAALAVVLFAACTDQHQLPGPGTLTATLRSPNGPEGAAVVLLAGEGVSQILPVGDTEAHFSASGDETRVVLVNQAGGTLAFEVLVLDRDHPPVGIVTEVAGPDDALRASLAGYFLEITP